MVATATSLRMTILKNAQETILKNSRADYFKKLCSTGQGFFHYGFNLAGEAVFGGQLEGVVVAAQLGAEGFYDEFVVGALGSPLTVTQPMTPAPSTCKGKHPPLVA